jgi:hypothetical protein
VFVGGKPGFTEEDLRAAVTVSLSFAETLRNLDYCHTGGNPRTIKKYIAIWGIDTSHFDPDFARAKALRTAPRPLPEVLVNGSAYGRASLKARLYREGLKERCCEMCGQGESWHGRKMSLILDHINGVRDDHRLENLRIVCPNCAATLDTHCGRQNRKPVKSRDCKLCGKQFRPKYEKHRYCSRECGQRVPRPERRKVERPPYEQLMAEIETTSYSAVGRKYWVSDNAIRKWVRAYERERDDGGED